MANPAAGLRAKVKAKYPDAVVSARGRNTLEHTVPSLPGKTVLDASIGDIHYGPSFDQEIDTAWQGSVAPWDYEMVKAGYNAYALANFSFGQVVKYVHPDSGEEIAFEPQGLYYSNDLDDEQQIVDAPQSVLATVTDDELYWAGAYGTDIDLKWQAQTARLDKRLIIQNASALPVVEQYIIDGGNPVLRLMFIFQKSTNVEIWVNDVLWDEKANNPVETSGYVEWKHKVSGEVLWSFNLPRSLAGEEESIGIFRLRKTGPNLFVEHRISTTWLAGAVYPVEIDITIDDQVEASTDDADEDNGDGYVDRAYPTIRFGKLGASRDVGMRFVNISGLSGATIDEVNTYLTFRANANDSNSFSGTFYADDRAAPTTFAITAYDISNRTPTTTTADGGNADFGNWTSGNDYNVGHSGTNKLGAVIQELADSYDPSSIVIIHDYVSGAGERVALSYNGSTTLCPKLHIEYTSGGTTLVIQESTHAHAADSPDLTQHNVLVVQESGHGHGAENLDLTQHNVLAIQDTSHGHVVEEPILTEHAAITIQESAHSHVAESPDLVQHNVLDVQESTHGHQAENLDLVQHNVLTIQESSHALDAENVVLSISITLVIQDSSHGHSAEGLDLVQHNVLAVQEAAHAHIAEGQDLVQHNVLVVEDAAHGHSVESLDLVQHNVLSIDESAHGHLVENIDLVPNHVLVVQDSAHGHTVENLDLVQHNVLSIDEAIHGHTADNVVLVIGGVLVIQDASHGHTAENVDLVQHNILVVSEAAHGHTAEILDLVQHFVLVINEALHAHSADSLDLTQHLAIIIQEALHGHSVEALDLTQQNVLTIDESGHYHYADEPTLISGEAIVLTIHGASHAHRAEQTRIVLFAVLAQLFTADFRAADCAIRHSEVGHNVAIHHKIRGVVTIGDGK
jgi:hypothetical protein